MILNIDNFNAAIDKRGVSHDDLASAVDREGLNAESAIRNWTRGNYKPKPTHDDLKQIAQVLSVGLLEIVQFEGTHRWARVAPRKARLLTDLIRGRDIDTALSLLQYNKKRAAVFVKKVLESAIAGAEEADADVTRLVVAESRVDEGPIIKRWRPKDRGRAHPIQKKTSHIRITVEESD